MFTVLDREVRKMLNSYKFCMWGEKRLEESPQGDAEWVAGCTPGLTDPRLLCPVPAVPLLAQRRCGCWSSSSRQEIGAYLTSGGKASFIPLVLEQLTQKLPESSEKIKLMSPMWMLSSRSPVRSRHQQHHPQVCPVQPSRGFQPQTGRVASSEGILVPAHCFPALLPWSAAGALSARALDGSSKHRGTKEMAALPGALPSELRTSPGSGIL